MTQQGRPTTRPREPLNRERVVRAAITLAAGADQLDHVSMRRLAHELGVEAMSLYNHVANKAALVDGMTDQVIEDLNARLAQAALPDPATSWRAALRSRMLVAREVMLEHRWVPAALESRRTISRALVIYFDGVMEILLAGGFSYDLAHHTLHALGSRALGFSQELFNPATPADESATQAELAAVAAAAPRLTEMLRHIAHDDPDSALGWCDDQEEFEFSLDVLIDGLAQRLRG